MNQQTDFEIEEWYLSSADIGRRYSLVVFWLSAPEDLVESLWEGRVGKATREVIGHATENGTTLERDEIMLRNELEAQIREKNDASVGINCMIAMALLEWKDEDWDNMTHSLGQIGKMERFIDLFQLYTELDCKAPGRLVEYKAKKIECEVPSAGESKNFMFTSEECKLLLDLSNLYLVDPEDEVTMCRLCDIRMSVVKAILDSDGKAIEVRIGSVFGDAYWTMVRSGIQARPHNDEEALLFKSLTTTLKSAGIIERLDDNHLRSLLGAMAFCKPGSFHIKNPETLLPGWLLMPYTEIFQ